MTQTSLDFDQAFERIKSAINTRTQVELATILDIRQSSISDAKRRNSVPADWLIKLFERFGLNPAWVKSGTGPQYLAPSDGAPLVMQTQVNIDTLPLEQLITAVVCRFPAGWSVNISRPGTVYTELQAQEENTPITMAHFDETL